MAPGQNRCKTKTYVVLHNELDDETLAISHACSFHITSNGLRVQPTPASAQKGISNCDSPPPQYGWNLSTLYEEAVDDVPVHNHSSQEEEAIPIPDVARKVAAKWYPTSVDLSSHQLR